MADLRNFLDGRTRTYDADMVLGPTGYSYFTSIPGKDVANVSATGGTDGYIDLGDGYTQGFACFDLFTLADGAPPQDIEHGGMARVFVQGAKDTSFATAVPLSILEFGNAATSIGTYAVGGGAKGDNVVDQTRYFVPFHNRYGDEMYRYVRMFVHLNASLATISISSFLTSLH